MPEEAIARIKRDRGKHLMQADLDEIRMHLARIPDLDRAVEVEAWVWEGLFLIVNDPSYAGDIPPSDCTLPSPGNTA